MMNFAVTGKKITTPHPTRKLPDFDSPFLIQAKPITQKTPITVKPKLSARQAPKPQPKKSQIHKGEPKKEIVTKKEEKIEKMQLPPPKIQEKVEENPVIVPEPLPEPKKEDVVTQVTVRYNHYKEQFPVINGVLSYLPIEQKYSFADVFRGKYLPILKIFKTNEQILPQTSGQAIEYSWKVTQGVQYKLQILEDEEEELKYDRKVYRASQNENNCTLKKNARFDELTEMMKKMDPSELGSEKHRALLQQRDLEDILYS